MERTYTIPLRREWLKAQRYKRAKKAVRAVRNFLQKHMKSEDVKVGKSINLEIWKHGMKNPPSKIKVNAVKDEKGVVKAELFGISIVQEAKKEKKSLLKKVAEKVTGKTETVKKAEA